MGKNLKSLRVHLVKKLQLDQEKLTKTSKNQIKLKQKKNKIKTKRTSKNKAARKKPMSKKSITLTKKNRFTMFGKGLGKRVI